MPPDDRYRPAKRHAELGDAFFDIVAPAPFPRHILRLRNQRWAARVGLATLSDAEWIAHFGRFEPLAGSFPAPLALRYHGHQFRSYNPDLGDGRGFLFAQLHDTENNRLLDLGTKGSGTTPWSRGGDGRLTLKGGVREVLATEMLEALGVETSKSFSLVETGEELVRGDEPSPTRSAVLVRLNHSHIRIGTFQRLSYFEQTDEILRLVDYALHAYMPDLHASLAEADIATRIAGFFAEVCRRTARLGAQWMAAGFVHGVLNTDNINITGESFDYGPWRFVPTYQPEFTAAYFDHSGLYAYGRQPETLMWNLARLGGCLLPLADKAALESGLATFWPTLHSAFAASLLRRLGLQPQGEEPDGLLARAFYSFLRTSQVPFEQAHFDWFGGIASAGRAGRGPAASFYAGPAFDAVKDALSSYKPSPGSRLDHPYFTRATPRTMLIDEVEAIWAPIAERDDWRAFETARGEIAEMGEAYASTTSS